MVFLYDDDKVYNEELIEYEFVKGLALSQKKKNVLNLHKQIEKKYSNLKILEISTKSNNSLGVGLSAFNLQLYGKTVETLFQSSKVYADGTSLKSYINLSPYEIKKVAKTINSKLINFNYNGIDYPLEPKTLFYDYLYISALKENKQYHSKIIEYSIFTDIEFNHEKSINCQARSCAIFKYLVKHDLLDKYLNDLSLFATLYKK